MATFRGGKKISKSEARRISRAYTARRKAEQRSGKRVGSVTIRKGSGITITPGRPKPEPPKPIGTIILKDPKTNRVVRTIQVKPQPLLAKGVVQGKVYTNITKAEIDANTLASNTRARVLPQETALRRRILTAEQKKAAGTATSADLFTIVSGGKKQIDLSKEKTRLKQSQFIEQKEQFAAKRAAERAKAFGEAFGAFPAKKPKPKTKAQIKLEERKKEIQNRKKDLFVTRQIERIQAGGDAGNFYSQLKKQNSFIKNIRKIDNYTLQLRKELREERRQIAKSDKKTFSQIAKGNLLTIQLLGATVGSSVFQLVRGTVELPSFIYAVSKNPKLLLEVPKQLEREAKKFIAVAKVAPDEAIVRIGAEIFIMKGVGKVIDALGDAARVSKAVVKGKFKGIGREGKVIEFKLPGKKTAKLQVVARMPSSTAKNQAALIGKKVNAISSQADELVGVIRRRRKAKKPIPSDIKIDKKTQALLNKFDKKTITVAEFNQLKTKVPILERSIFADPTGKIRPRRLGLVPDTQKKRLVQYLSLNIRLKRAKPQILFFPQTQVEKLPAALASLERKLRAGKKLTRLESEQLLNFQLTKSGKFKPIGFLKGDGRKFTPTRESEITLAPGEVVIRQKVRGTILVNGRAVDIVQAKIGKVTGQTRKLLDDFRGGKGTPADTRKLDKILKKKTGFNYGLSSYTKGKVYVNIKGYLANILTVNSGTTRKNLEDYNKKVTQPTKKVVEKKPKRRAVKKQKTRLRVVKRTTKRKRAAPKKPSRIVKRPSRRKKRPVKRPARPVKRPSKPVKRPVKRPTRPVKRPVKRPTRPIKRPVRRAARRATTRKQIIRRTTTAKRRRPAPAKKAKRVTKEKKKKKRRFTPTIKGLGRKAKRKQVRQKRFTGLETRGRKR